MKPLFVSIALIFLTNLSKSQTVSNCLEVSQLVNFPQILKNFRIQDTSDSLILIDKKNSFSGECIESWGRHNLRIGHDTVLARKVLRGASAGYGYECKYFFIDVLKQEGRYFTFTIFQACSNEFIDCKVLRKKEKYRLVWFSGGVY
jgi:hypothetical protein